MKWNLRITKLFYKCILGDLLIFLFDLHVLGILIVCLEFPIGRWVLILMVALVKTIIRLLELLFFLSFCSFPVSFKFGARCGGSASDVELEAIINVSAIADNRKLLPLTIYGEWPFHDCGGGVRMILSSAQTPLLEIIDRLYLFCKNRANHMVASDKTKPNSLPD